MAWSGSFLVLSILAHIILLGGATILIVQVVQGRKEKLKFTAPPPSAAAPAEHKVKPAKKKMAEAPAITKRITSTAANASIALPAMEMNSSSGPNSMASVMSDLGSSGLGAGAAGGMAAMPLSGLTAFGFKGMNGGGLVGHFYDMKQFADRKPTYTPGQSGEQKIRYFLTIREEFLKNWDESVLKRHYMAPDSMVAVQMYMPISLSSGAVKAFNVEKETHDPNWMILYKGTVVAPETATYRFIASADDFMCIRFNSQMAMPDLKTNSLPYISPLDQQKATGVFKSTGLQTGRMIRVGSWFSVEKGKSYPLEILIGDTGGLYHQILMIQELNPPAPYPRSKINSNYAVLPLVQFQKGIPLPKYTPELTTQFKDYTRNPDFAPEPVLFLVK